MFFMQIKRLIDFCGRFHKQKKRREGAFSVYYFGLKGLPFFKMLVGRGPRAPSHFDDGNLPSRSLLCGE